MEALYSNFFDYILHFDRYLPLVMEQYGHWIYAILFTIVFCETGLVAVSYTHPTPTAPVLSKKPQPEPSTDTALHISTKSRTIQAGVMNMFMPPGRNVWSF